MIMSRVCVTRYVICLVLSLLLRVARLVGQTPPSLCFHLGVLDESATCDHFFLPICLDLNEATSLDRAHVEVSSRMSAFGGGLSGSTQHSILKGKDGVFGNASRLFSRLDGIRECRALGSLASGRHAERYWAGVV